MRHDHGLEKHRVSSGSVAIRMERNDMHEGVIVLLTTSMSVLWSGCLGGRMNDAAGIVNLALGVSLSFWDKRRGLG